MLKASTVFESADNGDILCAVCPHAKLFVTAGASSVMHSVPAYLDVWVQTGKLMEIKYTRHVLGADTI